MNEISKNIRDLEVFITPNGSHHYPQISVIKMAVVSRRIIVNNLRILQRTPALSH